jgi:hypothetical protein
MLTDFVCLYNYEFWLSLCNGRLPANLKFTYNNRDLEIVPNFSYLGIAFSKSGSFNAAIITVSSAYKSTKSFKYTSSSISKSSVIDVRPLTFLSFINCSKSFKYIEKRKGKGFSPCRTPLLQWQLIIFLFYMPFLNC